MREGYRGGSGGAAGINCRCEAKGGRDERHVSKKQKGKKKTLITWGEGVRRRKKLKASKGVLQMRPLENKDLTKRVFPATLKKKTAGRNRRGGQ